MNTLDIIGYWLAGLFAVGFVFTCGYSMGKQQTELTARVARDEEYRRSIRK